MTVKNKNFSKLLDVKWWNLDSNYKKTIIQEYRVVILIITLLYVIIAIRMVQLFHIGCLTLRNIENLKSKKVAYFICCGFNENWKSYYEQNIPKDLLDTAIIYDTFGGEMDIQKQKGFDKFIKALS